MRYARYYIPLAGGTILSEYKSVRNKLLINVDFPRPDSPKVKTKFKYKFRNAV